MTPIINRLDEISDRYDAMFVDLWGCVHNGLRPFPEAVAALQAYRRKGGVVMLLTNCRFLFSSSVYIRPSASLASVVDPATMATGFPESVPAW